MISEVDTHSHRHGIPGWKGIEWAGLLDGIEGVLIVAVASGRCRYEWRVDGTVGQDGEANDDGRAFEPGIFGGAGHAAIPGGDNALLGNGNVALDCGFQLGVGLGLRGVDALGRSVA